MKWAGIDPGKTGAIAFVGSESDQFGSCPMPVGDDGFVDGVALMGILDSGPYRPSLIAIEWAQSMPKQGLVSTFNYGVSFGIVLGVVQSLGIPYILVRPQAWKKKILAGTQKDKAAALAYCAHRWPSVTLHTERGKPLDGVADALCLAEYARNH